MLYVKEDKEFEVGTSGGFKVTLNGKQINKYDNPENWKLLLAIKNEFPKEFAIFSQVFNPKIPDITLTKDEIILRDDHDGEILLQKKLSDTKEIKNFVR